MANKNKKQNPEEKAKKKFTPVSESAERKKESGNPGGGAGRIEEAGGSGVYPASGPLPESNAPYRGQMEFGQGERGAAGYYDSGDSEVNLEDRQAGESDRSNRASEEPSQDERQAARPANRQERKNK